MRKCEPSLAEANVSGLRPDFAPRPSSPRLASVDLLGRPRIVVLQSPLPSSGVKPHVIAFVGVTFHSRLTQKRWRPDPNVYFQGFTDFIDAAKSEALRVTSVSACTWAVAAMSASIA